MAETWATNCEGCYSIPCICIPPKPFFQSPPSVGPGPWECPRCGRMNGPQTERCVCKPGDAHGSPIAAGVTTYVTYGESLLGPRSMGEAARRRAKRAGGETPEDD